jgi:hypothetical protein
MGLLIMGTRLAIAAAFRNPASLEFCEAISGNPVVLFDLSLTSRTKTS